MLREYDVLEMFGGLKSAAQMKREPNRTEIADAFADGLSILASIVESLTVLAEKAQTDYRDIL